MTDDASQISVRIRQPVDERIEGEGGRKGHGRGQECESASSSQYRSE